MNYPVMCQWEEASFANLTSAPVSVVVKETVVAMAPCTCESVLHTLDPVPCHAAPIRLAEGHGCLQL